jgi:hypothetical protein
MSRTLTSGTYLGWLGILLVTVVLLNTEVGFDCIPVAVHIQELSCIGMCYAQYIASPAQFVINNTAQKPFTLFGKVTK